MEYETLSFGTIEAIISPINFKLYPITFQSILRKEQYKYLAFIEPSLYLS